MFLEREARNDDRSTYIIEEIERKEDVDGNLCTCEFFLDFKSVPPVPFVMQSDPDLPGPDLTGGKVSPEHPGKSGSDWM